MGLMQVVAALKATGDAADETTPKLKDTAETVVLVVDEVPARVRRGLLRMRAEVEEQAEAAERTLDVLRETAEETEEQVASSLRRMNREGGDTYEGVSEALRKLLEASETGESGVSILFDPRYPNEPRQAGGALSFEYAFTLVEKLADIVTRVEQGGLNPFQRADASRAMQFYRDFFQRFFPQLGSVERLVKELIEYRRRSSDEDAPHSTGTLGRSKRGTVKRSASLAVLRWSGGLP